MSDPLQPSFAGLRGQRPPAAFAPTDHIRRRGRRRARRQAVLAGVAALAVAGVGAGAVAATVGGPGTQPPVGAPATPTPIASPSGTATPAPDPPLPMPADGLDQWLLTADDLGPGQWQADTWEPEWTEGPDSWRWEGACPGYRSEDYPSLAGRTDLLTLSWTDGPFDESDIPRWLHLIVEVFESEVSATGNLHDVRAVIARCDDGDTAPFGSYEVTDAGFAGDESMLVRHRIDIEGGEVVEQRVVVRVGPAVVTLYGYDPELGDVDADLLQDLAARVAGRLP